MIHLGTSEPSSLTPAPTTTPTPTPTPMSRATALQAALAAEHAAVYGFGIVGARLPGPRQASARAGFDIHRVRRDRLTELISTDGEEPVAAAPAYDLPFPVVDAASAVRLAAYLEAHVAAVYADLVTVSNGDMRGFASDALADAATRAVFWRGTSVAFPGLPERAN